MQLSVIKFFAEYTVRGANLDTLELPLNNAPYLLVQFDNIRAMPTSQQWAALQQLAHWTDIGEGDFYDDLGDVDNQPHLVVPTTWLEDPDSYINPLNARAIAKDVHWSKRFETPAAVSAHLSGFIGVGVGTCQKMLEVVVLVTMSPRSF
eukprot:m.207120 g.207120  ORF g.207120 m.207120 type:complete len:149 (-) comp32974_c0_seq48:88-534(-)